MGMLYSFSFVKSSPNRFVPAAVASVSQQLSGGVQLPNQLPPLFSDESKIPTLYYQALALCQMNNQLPNTALVYNLMVTSNLPRDMLGYIWSLVNRTLPGQLTRPEFFAYLALIALAQASQSFCFNIPALVLTRICIFRTVNLRPIRRSPACSPCPSPNSSCLR